MEFNVDKAVNMLVEKLQSWLELGITGLPNFLIAMIIMFLFYFLAKISRKVVFKLASRLTINRSVNDLLSTLTYLVVILTGLFIALGILNLDKTVTSLLAGAGVIGLAIGFAAQEVAANFFSGVIIAFREPYTIGDIIEISDHKGRVKSVNLRTTNIVTFDGLEVFIPNRLIFSEPFTNLTSTSDRRINLNVGVSYGDDLEIIPNLIKKSLEDVPYRLKNKEVAVYFTDFGDSSINLVVHVWVKYTKTTDYLQAKHETVLAIKRVFDQNDITIPFPIRTLDFGIKGGEKLSTSLSSFKAN